ncbi:MAG: hypothetical protein SNJ55_05315 [Chloroherpetonaceae bacterium]
MAKITIEVHTEEEWQRAFEYAQLLKGSTVQIEWLSHEERKQRIKEFLEWTETNRVKIDEPIVSLTREERNAR